jgi:hypothetical protein
MVMRPIFPPPNSAPQRAIRAGGDPTGLAVGGRDGILDYNWTMSMLRSLTAVIERDGDGYVAICPEFDIASQGNTVDEARS